MKTLKQSTDVENSSYQQIITAEKSDIFTTHKDLLRRIIAAYDSPIVRAYCKVRFTIININILNILSLCLRDRKKILDIGCGFGLFGCYFASLFPEIEYHGYEINLNRIEMAKKTANRLNLENVHFTYGDARELTLSDKYEAIMMIDLLHHLDDSAKEKLLFVCSERLTENGKLVIKDVTTHPFWKIGFTWVLDLIMTKSFDMWYWDEKKVTNEIMKYFYRIDTFPISDLLPYPHIVYLSESKKNRNA
jgi:2-polyprenyl-3-methyl-5-hydroxy-6-metoxy-1,4-benzoquinol methylase